MRPDPRHSHPLPTHGGELLLVRHGQSTANARGIGQGRAEYPLSDRGHAQAAATGRHLKHLGGISAVYTSPLSRAAQTAQAIAAKLGLTPLPVPELVELDVGVLSNRTWDELKREHPEVMRAFEEAEAARPHPRNRELIPGWEPVDAVLERTWTAIATLAAAHPGERVVVVAHGAVLNAFLTHVLTGDAREVPWAHHQHNCAITRLLLAPEGPSALCVGDDSHLGPLGSVRP